MSSNGAQNNEISMIHFIDCYEFVKKIYKPGNIAENNTYLKIFLHVKFGCFVINILKSKGGLFCN